jgi:hypothetical protein
MLSVPHYLIADNKDTACQHSTLIHCVDLDVLLVLGCTELTLTVGGCGDVSRQVPPEHFLSPCIQ